jgi:hypothetical protein
MLMTASWKQGFDIGHLTAMLEGAKETDANGVVHYEWFKLERAISILQSCVEISPDIPPRQKEEILRAAINRTIRWRAIKSRELINAISSEEERFLTTSYRAYVLATSLSIRYFPELRPIVAGSGRISFSERLPRHFEQGETVADAERSLGLKTPPAFTRVRVAVKGRSDIEAYYRAMEMLAFFRAIWNLDLNRRLLTFHSGRVRPINQILLGPIHTLHDASGKLVTDNVWYEPDFFDRLPENIRINWPSLRKYEQYVRKRLYTVKYAELIKACLIRYTRALDQQDLGGAFQSLWSILETMSGTGKASYDVTIRRTLFLYLDPTNHRLVLEHLRSLRNDMIHLGQGTHEHNVERVLRQLMSYVHDFFRFYLEIRHGLYNFNEIIKLFDIEQDLTLLRDKIAESKHHTRLLKKALDLRTP